MASENSYPDNLEAFGEPFQQVIVGHCLNEQSFLAKCRTMVQKEWFTNILCSELIRIIYDIYDSKRAHNAQSSLPTVTEISLELAKLYPNMRDRQERMAMLDRCAMLARDTSLDFLRERMTGWIQMITLKRMFEEGVSQYKRKQFEKCRDWVADKIAEIKKTTFLEDNRESFANAIEMFRQRASALMENCVTFGHPAMDELLCEGSQNKNAPADTNDITKMTRGGLLPGETTVLMGTTNSGKTTTVITLIVMNVLMGRHVLFFTHEQVAADIKSKLVSCLLAVSMREIQDAAMYTPEQIAAMPAEFQRRHQTLLMGIRYAEGMLEKYLHYVHWTKYGKMYVEDVMDELQALQDLKVAERAKPVEKGGEGRTDGRGYDLLVDDYPAKLRSRQQGNSKQWDMLAYIYDQFVLSAERNKFHGVLTVQTNRTGYQVNRGDSEEGRNLDIDDVAGAYGIMTIASNVITLNRSDWDKANSTIRYYIPKCRTAATGKTMIAKSNFNLGRAFLLNQRIYIQDAGTKVSPQELSIALGMESDTERSRREHINSIMTATPTGVPLQTTQPVVESAQPAPVPNVTQEGTPNEPKPTQQ